MLDHFIANSATAHKVNSHYTLAISYCTFCVRKHTILGPDVISAQMIFTDATARDIRHQQCRAEVPPYS